MVMPIELISNCPLVRYTKPIRFEADGNEFHVRPRKLEALVWVSLTKRDARRTQLNQLEARAVADHTTLFPALVDTGCNESFLIHQWHLDNWVRLPLKEFDPAGRAKSLLGQACPAIDADLWLHPFDGEPTAPPSKFEQAYKLVISGGATVSFIRSSRVLPFTARLTQPSLWERVVSYFSPRSGGSAASDQVEGWVGAEMVRNRDSIPFDVYPRLPLIGMKAIHTNRLAFSVDGTTGSFSIQRPPSPLPRRQ